MEFHEGMIVRANAGRDKQKFFVVVGLTQNKVLIADGKSRKLENPKQKNPKHLSMTTRSVNTENLTDKQLKSILAEFN